MRKVWDKGIVMKIFMMCLLCCLFLSGCIVDKMQEPDEPKIIETQGV